MRRAGSIPIWGGEDDDVEQQICTDTVQARGKIQRAFRSSTMTASGHITTRFGSIRPGPEAALQAHIELALPTLFDLHGWLVWTGGAVPVGAGQPDLLLAKCHTSISKLGAIRSTSHLLLGYLRAVGCASPATISVRLGRSDRYVSKLIDELSQEGIVESNSRGVYLADDCRDILKDVVAIEVKVSDWRRATHQAIRNTILAHRSYIALPSAVAGRVRDEELMQAFGIGILSVDANGAVKTVRRARKAAPKVWSYYYAIASLASESLVGSVDAVRRPC